jgi:hypothetical protein
VQRRPELRQRIRNEQAEVFQRRRVQPRHVVQQVMVQQPAHIVEPAPQQPQVDHHARDRIAFPRKPDFGVVRMAVDAAAAFHFDLAFERMSGVEEKALTDGEAHKRRPAIGFR